MPEPEQLIDASVQSPAQVEGFELLTLAKAAEYLNISLKTMRKYVSEDYVPHIHVSAKKTLIRSSSLAKWLEARESKGRMPKRARRVPKTSKEPQPVNQAPSPAVPVAPS